MIRTSRCPSSSSISRTRSRSLTRPVSTISARGETGIALYDEAHAAYYGAQYLAFEIAGHAAQFAEEKARSAAAWFTARAKGLDAAAARFSAQAASLAHRASQERAYAAAQQALARQYWNEANRLAKAYAAQQARKAWAAAKRLVKKAVKAVKKFVKKVARTVAQAAVAVAHYVAKHAKVTPRQAWPSPRSR